jgi:hypothetical protein
MLGMHPEGGVLPPVQRTASSLCSMHPLKQCLVKRPVFSSHLVMFFSFAPDSSNLHART